MLFLISTSVHFFIPCLFLFTSALEVDAGWLSPGCPPQWFMRNTQVTSSKASDWCERLCVSFVVLAVVCKTLLIIAEDVLSHHAIVLMPMCLSHSGAVVSAVKRENIWKKKKINSQRMTLRGLFFSTGKNIEHFILKVGISRKTL